MIHEDHTKWPKGSPIRVIKLSACEAPLFPPCSWDDWRIYEENTTVSFPVDYEVEGALMDEMEVGKPIVVLRTHRNGVRADGFFYTSPVREFKNGAAITMNSIYFIKILEDPIRAIEFRENS